MRGVHSMGKGGGGEVVSLSVKRVQNLMGL